jgi:hypothetical protein
MSWATRRGKRVAQGVQRGWHRWGSEAGGKIRSVLFGGRKKDGRGSEDGEPRTTTLHPRGGGGIPPEPFGGNGSVNRQEPNHTSLISVNARMIKQPPCQDRSQLRRERFKSSAHLGLHFFSRFGGIARRAMRL